VITPSALARQAEQLRFRIDHHLGGDPEDLIKLLQQLEARVAHHAVVRNARAAQALPETVLPAPPPELSAAASAWIAGDAGQALAKGRRALSDRPHPRTAVTVADLCWATGRPDEALAGWEAVRSELGSLVPLLVRLGRAALVQGRTGEALERAVQALGQNPLHGTAFVLLAHTHRARGAETVPVPLPARLAVVDGQLKLARGLGERARRAWTDALKAAREAPPDETPPGRSALHTLLQTWRSLPVGSAKEQRVSWTVQALDRWERAGVLDSYLWAVGLNPDTAHAFRRRPTPQARDQRFWTEQVVETSGR
jgi:hypothetical protein